MSKPDTTYAYVRADDWKFVNDEAKANLRSAKDQFHVILEDYRRLRDEREPNTAESPAA